MINKKYFQVHTVSNEDYFAVESYNNPSNKLDISLIKDCESWAPNITYEVWDIDENIFKKEKILEEKNFFEKVDLFYVFIFIIFLVSIIFTIFSLRKLKKKL